MLLPGDQEGGVESLGFHLLELFALGRVSVGFFTATAVLTFDNISACVWRSMGTARVLLSVAAMRHDYFKTLVLRISC